ncbi:hypothetical protein BBJ28_00006078 [Nothophytophthora sp. Chile5]|nr:hypothetical protein BBJ28_00006078 [Nothophytophthora sp. Chile5]
MVLCVAVDRFPTITLSADEQRHYDQFSNDLLKRTLRAYHEEARPDLNRSQWAPVRHRGRMDVYKNVEGSTNPKVTLYLGKGLMKGTVEDIMDGLYCDTTDELRKVKTLLNYQFIDGAVFQVSQRRSADAPFRFAGIKWFAAKTPLGPLVADRDMLNYEVMGQVMDEHGNEFAFHSYQSIERPEWPADNIKNIKRAHTATCYLYRAHSFEYVECFFQGDFVARGKVMQKVSDYAMAGKWLAVSNAVQCAQAKKFSHLMDCVDAKQSFPRSRPIFQTSTRTGKPLTEHFCIPCVKKVTGDMLLQRKMTVDDDTRETRAESSVSDSGADDTVNAFLV